MQGREPLLHEGDGGKEEQDGGREQDGALDVEALPLRGAAVGQDPEADEERDDADGHVDEEDDAPGGYGDEGAANGGAGHGAEGGEGGQQPEGAASAVCEHLGDDALVVGHAGSDAEPLDGARGDEDGQARRKGAQERPHGEGDDAELEDANLADHVAETAEGEQERAAHHQQRARDPLDEGHVHLERGLQGGERHVGDRGVEHLHERHAQNDDEGEVLLPLGELCRG